MAAQISFQRWQELYVAESEEHQRMRTGCCPCSQGSHDQEEQQHLATQELCLRHLDVREPRVMVQVSARSQHDVLGLPIPDQCQHRPVLSLPDKVPEGSLGVG